MFSGSFVALITPMKASGQIDFSSLVRLCRYHLRSGTAGLVVGGTTGEVLGLTEREWFEVVEVCAGEIEGKLPLVVGLSTVNIVDSIRRLNQLKDLPIAAVLTMIPYYIKPPQRGIIEYLRALLESSALPHILYNNPARSGIDLSDETIVALAEHEQVVGIKDASGRLDRIQYWRKYISRPFALFSGNDGETLAWLKAGGDGVISVSANIIAPEMAKLCHAAAIPGKGLEAEQLNDRYMPLYQALTWESNPIVVKWAASHIGLIPNPALRLPLSPLAPEYRTPLEHLLNSLISARRGEECAL